MSHPYRNLLPNSNSPINVHITSLKLPPFFISSLRKSSSSSPHLRIPWTQSSNQTRFISFKTHHWPVKVFNSDRTVQKADGINSIINLDAFLSIVEFLCLASSAVISIGFAVKSAIPSLQKPVFALLGDRVFVWQFVILVGAVAIGGSIRRRQWSRICADCSKTGNSGVNLAERIEKLEEDLRSSATIIKVLSRHVEKLGTRFRDTRKALKEPISEAVALAQKNSEATRALAVQADILEKELSEIQKVLLAMQQQQEKQLKLILAITKIGKLWSRKRVPSQEQEAIETRNSAGKATKQTIQSLALLKEANNDRA
ncbi:hypothetical protein U1Q18_011284 [Sarracenia purpurea var. burkii]